MTLRKAGKKRRNALINRGLAAPSGRLKAENIGRDLTAFRANGCHVDITLKDVETVQGDTERVRKWVAIARSLADEIMGG